MTIRWHNPQTERLIAAYLASDRPAWVWAGDSEKLIWRNRASRAYEAVNRRKPHDMLVPVARQVPRTIRMGVPFRTSRARLQFALGRKPLSATCACTPVRIGTDQPALLVVIEDAVGQADLEGVAFEAESIAPFVSDAAHYALTGTDGVLLFAGGDGAARLNARQAPETTLAADDTGASHLVLFPEAAPEALAEDTIEPDMTAPVDDIQASSEDAAPAEDQTDAPAEDHVESPAEPASEAPQDAPEEGDGLVSLLDRLDSRQVLYQPLDDSDDAAFLAPVISEPETDPVPETGGEAEAETEAETEAPVAETDQDAIQEPDEPTASDTAEPAPPAEDAASVPVRLWRVIGRGLLPHAGQPESDDRSEAPADMDAPDTEIPDGSEMETGTYAEAAAETDSETGEREDDETQEDAETIERTTRYNFDELSRILTDRVAADGNSAPDRSEDTAAPGAGALVNLGDETLILNRLPVGLLVFRDQQILFSNRALTDLLGYVDGTSLRRAGLAGVFPPEGDQDAAGPVTKLMGADGRLLTVSARLQSISWQGKPALLLSASRQKEPLNAEDLARGFAEFMANALEYGYFETSRAGILTSVSGRAALLSGRSPDALIERPLNGLIALNQTAKLRAFLEQPARFAGVERPMERFVGADPETEVIVFAEGMAGIVTGYFGLVRKTETPAETEGSRDIDTGFLVRLGRAVRQPVNAIVGFADMIRSQTYGPVGNDRYADYARFIHSAGQDIVSVVDELENYARLSEKTYPVETAHIDLVELLEDCVARVRPFASSVRVLVRSGVSSSLPGISADRQTLVQAVLNVLASAVAHSPRGGQVVLSAQKRSDGGVEVHVRDSGSADGGELDDRFVVFRDGKTNDGDALAPIPSTIGLALTKALLAVNACSLEIVPSRGNGTLSSLLIPAECAETADSVSR